MMMERVIAVVLPLIVYVAAIEGGAVTKKRSAEEYGEGFENGLARVRYASFIMFVIIRVFSYSKL